MVFTLRLVCNISFLSQSKPAKSIKQPGPVLEVGYFYSQAALPRSVFVALSCQTWVGPYLRSCTRHQITRFQPDPPPQPRPRSRSRRKSRSTRNDPVFVRANGINTFRAGSARQVLAPGPSESERFLGAKNGLLKRFTQHIFSVLKCFVGPLGVPF